MSLKPRSSAGKKIPPLRGAWGVLFGIVKKLKALCIEFNFYLHQKTHPPAPLKGGIMRVCAFSFILIILASCTLQPSKPEIAPKQFAEIYTALQIIAAHDRLSATQADSILATHGFSRAQFEHAANYYNARAEAWAEVLRHSVARLDSIVAQQTQHDSTSTAEKLQQRE